MIKEVFTYNILELDDTVVFRSDSFNEFSDCLYLLMIENPNEIYKVIINDEFMGYHRNGKWSYDINAIRRLPRSWRNVYERKN